MSEIKAIAYYTFSVEQGKNMVNFCVKNKQKPATLDSIIFSVEIPEDFRYLKDRYSEEYKKLELETLRLAALKIPIFSIFYDKNQDTRVRNYIEICDMRAEIFERYPRSQDLPKSMKDLLWANLIDVINRRKLRVESKIFVGKERYNGPSVNVLMPPSTKKHVILKKAAKKCAFYKFFFPR